MIESQSSSRLLHVSVPALFAVEQTPQSLGHTPALHVLVCNPPEHIPCPQDCCWNNSSSIFPSQLLSKLSQISGEELTAFAVTLHNPTAHVSSPYSQTPTSFPYCLVNSSSTIESQSLSF